jgi:hypothetical protein
MYKEMAPISSADHKEFLGPDLLLGPVAPQPIPGLHSVLGQLAVPGLPVPGQHSEAELASNESIVELLGKLPDLSNFQH